MVKQVRTPGFAKQTMSREELYGGWPLHGIPDNSSDAYRPLIRKKKTKTPIMTEQDKQELSDMIDSFEDCCE